MEQKKMPPAGEGGRRVMVCTVYQGHSVRTVRIPVSHNHPARKKSEYCGTMGKAQYVAWAVNAVFKSDAEVSIHHSDRA